ncbi:MAG: formamidopyrimidine DNA glycosylase [Gammaproteobacteria bacterium]|nr:formamidopyrimidine DNA glycosylase [Gammaproteobacteria bacterium]
MPEGDTVAKLAAALGPLLAGAAPVRVEVRGAPSGALDGRRVEGVHAVGKHLFLAFEGGRLLRSHLGMYGSWHRYGRGEPWQRPARQASIVIDLGERVVVCFNAREVEVLRADGLRHRDLLARLGPSLAGPGPDLAAAVARARSTLEDATPLTDLLLDQRVASGVGNVYKSEVLFLEGLHPGKTLAATGDDRLAAVFARAADLMRQNLGGGPRVTRFDDPGSDPLWVYGRRGRPCLRCGSPIRYARTGRTQRSTYWCPRCQPP